MMSPSFFWTMVPTTNKIIGSSNEGQMWTMNNEAVHKIDVDDISRQTGCLVVTYPPQPEKKRPEPFYYLQGTFDGVIQATHMLHQMIIKYQDRSLEDYEEKYDINKCCSYEGHMLTVPRNVPLYKCLGLDETASSADKIAVLNSWCVPGTKIEGIQNCKVDTGRDCEWKLCPCIEAEHRDSVTPIPCQNIWIIGPEKVKIKQSRDIILEKLFENLHNWR